MGLRSFIAARLPRAPTPEPSAASERETKSSQGGGGAFMLTGSLFAGASLDGERSYQGLARAGFLGNPIVHRSVRLIAETTAAVPLLLYEGVDEIEDHALLDLLRRPNGGQDGTTLMEALCGHLMLAGNAYLEASMLDERPRALHVLRPDRMRVVVGRDGWPDGYDYRVGSTVRRLRTEAPDGPGPLLHLKLFHPLDDGAGFSPLGAARAALDLHNAAARWNTALLENSARPSGALVYQPGDGANLSPDQFDRLKAELENGYTGAARAGRPMLLEGGLDWKAMALSPKDMDFIEAKNQAAREIALAFGVPPMLLGIPGDATYANYAEANRAFYRLTVLPLAARIAGALGGWLALHFGAPALRLAPDPDRVEGLSLEREALWSRIGAAGFLTDDEKREAVGYGPRR